MPQYCIYLISSLPMLQFGMKPPFSLGRFLKLCEGKISAEDFSLLEKVSISGDYIEGSPFSTLQRWRIFDTALRNELVRIRAGRLQRDPEKYLHHDGYTDPSIARIAMNAHRNLSILEAERMLDEERWRMLDELSFSHYFDIDFLVIYAYKLLILMRWDRIHPRLTQDQDDTERSEVSRAADSSRMLEEILK